MSLTIQTTDLRRRVRDVLERVRTKKEVFIIKSYNTPQAVILPFEEYENYQTWQTDQQKRAAWLAELQQIADGVTTGAALGEEKAQYLVDEAIQGSGQSELDARKNSFEVLIRKLPAYLQQEVRDFAGFLLEREQQKQGRTLRQDWAGALRDYGRKYTALELQKKALEWRGD